MLAGLDAYTDIMRDWCLEVSLRPCSHNFLPSAEWFISRTTIRRLLGSPVSSNTILLLTVSFSARSSLRWQ